jgi:LPXTG-motif cell wall-anchored protein
MNSSERDGERGFLIFVFTIVTSENKNKGRIIGFYLLLATLFLIFYKKRREEKRRGYLFNVTSNNFIKRLSCPSYQILSRCSNHKKQ